jgi:hypothetical protein
MTTISGSRHLRRLTACAIHSGGKNRSIVLELDPSMPGLVGFRLKGTKTTYYLEIGWAYREAMRAELARQKAERKAERKRTA